MIVLPVKGFDMKRDSGIDREGLEPFIHQLGIEGADLVAAKLDPEYQEWPARYVDGDASQRFVHGHVHVGIAGDAPHVAQRLLDGLAERDSDIFGSVVLVDVQVASGLDGEVDPGVACEEIEHVVEEADPGLDRGRAAAVEIDGNRNVGLLGNSFDLGLAHPCPPRSQAPCIRGSPGPLPRGKQ